ncbi:hypothetical protein F153LOC_08700 [Lelliottia sp. F153]|jgi:Protein of unknown function (DUF2732).|uniref:DUF2732 family protein n=1 Tax=Lelliottia TaxID=1330545 RepID=UPI000C7F1D54|nr:MULTISPECIES: DUF2732 family protein [Lelliottia]AVY97589.1 DUF2732 domain-containing protein [Lelliottia sp. WB101]MCD4560411.1 DUF2732 domain-containing protein [Lelliottia nimipressuralis]PLY45691.1 hypothetical protein F159LOC_11755 [Lelliottia sp. F159]PLY51854.1 hypothetical protein F154LOC_04750 [Lelliottia sp. F154]PLY55216.1 hypothetical protein F153LOC_08700 [Lelliottia sp. F153]
MRNNEINKIETDPDSLAVLLSDVKNEERKAHALVFSKRLKAMALHISYQGLNSTEAAELLRGEAEHLEYESQVQH